MRHFSEPEIAAIEIPVLAFSETAKDVKNYEKYFYFHRLDTSFDEAYADIRECDALSDGRASYGGDDVSYGVVQGVHQQMIEQYGMAGAVGGVVGQAVGAAAWNAIYGSAERRKNRRLSMRNCMHYKGYDRLGLTKDIWEEFNFEEGNGRKDEALRERAMLIQARVASGPKPQQKAIEP